ncbi:MOSC domain-containing protein [Novosphingobium sp. 9]|uniref:MOSC domain-containing protein n=1 Tax=Novosphingobium sp. 9 TaxID=2025349 RepID=UPI0021B57138|nr:MOSC domain-containing protein [Novosphingobium sp. 9]
MTSPVALISLATGKVRPFRNADEPSAIAKVPVTGAVRVTFLGLEGDEQADLSVHGGHDKAIHHYPHDHYAFWREAIGDHGHLAMPGAFGENVSTTGLTEGEVCIGDRWRLGSALVEVSQGRQPCWKLDHRFDGARVNAAMIRTRRPGWYYRVIEEGEAVAGEPMTLVARPCPDWSVARVFGLLIAGDHKTDRAGLEALGAVSMLAEPWKRRRVKLLG